MLNCRFLTLGAKLFDAKLSSGKLSYNHIKFNHISSKMFPKLGWHEMWRGRCTVIGSQIMNLIHRSAFIVRLPSDYKHYDKGGDNNNNNFDIYV